jgi:hypothetical protein
MTVLTVIIVAVAIGGDPWADDVVSYVPGRGGVSGYDDPLTALGPPERFSGEGAFPGVVSQFQPAWTPLEIVSLAAGGSIVVAFDEPVVDDPWNPWGIDLLIFGNIGFSDDGDGGGRVAGYMGPEGGVISVSQDGVTWWTITSCTADGTTPTVGYLDAGPFDTAPGVIESDFTRPTDPRLTIDEVHGLWHEELQVLYGGSGGGSGVDLAEVGLEWITFVQITCPEGAQVSPEVDAMVDVAPRRQGDVNFDGVTSVLDLLMVIDAWGPLPPGGIPADFDLDGSVGILDLLIVLSGWGETP